MTLKPPFILNEDPRVVHVSTARMHFRRRGAPRASGSSPGQEPCTAPVPDPSRFRCLAGFRDVDTAAASSRMSRHSSRQHLHAAAWVVSRTPSHVALFGFTADAQSSSYKRHGAASVSAGSRSRAHGTYTRGTWRHCGCAALGSTADGGQGGGRTPVVPTTVSALRKSPRSQPRIGPVRARTSVRTTSSAEAGV